MKKSLAFLSLVFCLYSTSKSQVITDQSGNEADLQLNTITTAVPFLIIGPDAKSGGMGDVGVASTPDAMSMHWNPAKYAFVDDDFGISVAYTPWLRALIPDINLSYISGYARTNERETFGFALRYFTLGEIKFTGQNGESMGFFNPNELALSTAYARKLSDKFSTAISLRYIYSNLTGGAFVGTQSTNAGQSIAGDISAYYENPIRLGGNDVMWAMGLNISNIGSKIAYTETVDKDFIPTNLRIGSSLATNIDEYNRISFEFNINKLLVPTPPKYNNDNEIISGEDPDVSVISGIFQSFSDAPAGDREVRELIYSTGLEYWYDQQFAIRSGYFYEHPLKGDRQFLSLGAGLRYNVFGLDFSYLIPVESRKEAGVVNPLSNTLRFALTFDFGALQAQEAEADE
jgi:hypothetical protein